VLGLASGKTYGPWQLPFRPTLLMDFLRAQGIPVASSCGGDGVCRKCVVNEDVLSCQVTVEQFLSDHPSGVVGISYL
jgi:uncharacterized 2Fe-2S/4Fe-4S cluster protein (DUF4445 family)